VEPATASSAHPYQETRQNLYSFSQGSLYYLVSRAYGDVLHLHASVHGLSPPAYPAVAKTMLMILAAQSAGAKKKVRKAASLVKLQLKSVAELV
jgi:hypothetical protein